MKRYNFRALVAGCIGGLAGNALLGILFTTPWIKGILFDPSLQSQNFIALASQRNIPVSVAGLVVLSGVHGYLFSVLSPSIPGTSWIQKGLWWGGVIWASYWLLQEWFIYVTLIGEPLSLALLELVVLLLGSLLEGLVIAKLVEVWKQK